MMFKPSLKSNATDNKQFNKRKSCTILLFSSDKDVILNRNKNGRGKVLYD